MIRFKSLRQLIKRFLAETGVVLDKSGLLEESV